MKVLIAGETVFGKSGSYTSRGALVEKAYWVN